MTDAFVGEVRMFGFKFAPKGWAFCQGQALNIQQNTALFSLLGFFYGGDRQNTFVLPDLRGCALMMPARTPRSNADCRGGAETMGLTVLQLPPHNHPLKAVSNPAAANWKPTPNATRHPSNVGKDSAGNTTFYYADHNDIADTSTTRVAIAPTTIGNAGGNQAHDNVQPSTAVNYCIAISGIYPPRN